jgi:hypothetical protein
VDHGTGPDDVEKRKFLTLPGLELRPLRLAARLSYTGKRKVLGGKPSQISTRPP